jgi:CRISPR/Cas system-associated endoribonuclease Cas2
MAMKEFNYSVFTGLVAPHRNKPLWASLEKIANSKNYPADKIICFAISKTAFQNMKVMGNFTADIQYLLGQKHTEIV